MPYQKTQRVFVLLFIVFSLQTFTVAATDRVIKITKQYLNIPVGEYARLKLVQLVIGQKSQRDFPVQLAEDSIDYWIYVDVSAFKGKTVTISCKASSEALSRIYQDDQIRGADSMYAELNRPQVHLTVKRGWSNDINGPIFYNGNYHLFWQAFPFGKSWNTGYMYWGHATSKDLLHWTELPAALMLDSLGSPWSGTAVIDHNNASGFGKNALILYYTAYDLTSFNQVQCIAYSNDGGISFKRYRGNPVVDSNREMDSNDTRDPKVFYYEPGHTWVMVLFEKDGMSFYNSTDMKSWIKQSHFKGLYECPDFFELPVDGDNNKKKWVLHGGSADYQVGIFDGKTFTAETPKLRYAEGKSLTDDDLLYAAESFENMPDNRRVQIAWGRAQHPGMPFTQMMLFPTEFSLITTSEGIRLVANPIQELEKLHAASNHWESLSVAAANEKLAAFKKGPLHIRLSFTPGKDDSLRLMYNNEVIANLPAGASAGKERVVEMIIDRTTAEVFVDKGKQYLLTNFKDPQAGKGLVFETAQQEFPIRKLEVYPLHSIWNKTK